MKNRVGRKGITHVSNTMQYKQWEMLYQLCPDICFKTYNFTERFVKGRYKFMKWKYEQIGVVLDIGPYESFFEELKNRNVKDRDYETLSRICQDLTPNTLIECCVSGRACAEIDMSTNRIVKVSTLQSHVKFKTRTFE